MEGDKGRPMLVLVIGAGPVGLVAAAGFAREGHRVICAEQDPTRFAALERGSVPFFEPGLEALVSEGVHSGRLSFVRRVADAPPCEVVVVAVGTPSQDNGEVDLRYVFDAVHEIVRWAREPLIIAMKSTVPPGTGSQIERRFLQGTAKPIHYVANPEFLREGHAVHDWFHPTRTVVGAQVPEALSAMRGLYQGIRAPLFEMDVTTAEMVKYSSNAFLATKVSFINEIANLCEAVGADVDQVAQAMGADPRIGADYLQAGVGYGGSCFPKDTRALNAMSDANGYAFRLLKAVIEVNARQQERAVQRVADALGSHLQGARVAVLGVAFKPETDDVRESPALEIIPHLLEAGAQVAIWDPRAMDSARPVLPEGVAFAANAYEACADCHAVMVLTAWPEIVSLDWKRIKHDMVDPYIVFDGRNCLPDGLALAGLTHLRIGRPEGSVTEGREKILRL
jgi:UDPglucose 6-dehydrogenase